MSQTGPGVPTVIVNMWFSPPKQDKFTSAEEPRLTLNGGFPVTLNMAYAGGLLVWHGVIGGYGGIAGLKVYTSTPLAS